MERGGVRKILQRQLYTFLSSKWGALLCLIGFFTLLNASFTVLMLALGREPGWRDWTDNVAGEAFRDTLCSPPIDIVYTWVNGSDPLHQRGCYKDIDSFSRYADNEELRYSLRTIEKFAPWIRRIYLVTNGQVPYWLNLDAPRLTVVTHAELFTNQSHLPTFSSPAIETHIHRIPGLSDKFLYLNDDVMFGNTVWPEDFYSPQLGYKVYLSWQAPMCAPGCFIHYLGDGFCDDACNHTLCDYDQGECLNETIIAKGSRWGRHGGRHHHHHRGNSDDSQCARACVDNWIGDKACDNYCNNKDCGYDAGDCGLDLIVADLPSRHVYADTKEIHFDTGTAAGYLNLSTLLTKHGSHLSDAVHTHNHMVRQALWVPMTHMMVFVFTKGHKGCVDITVRYRILKTDDTPQSTANETVTEVTEQASLDSTQPSTPPPPPPPPFEPAIIPSNLVTSLNTTLPPSSEPASVISSPSPSLTQAEERLDSVPIRSQFDPVRLALDLYVTKEVKFQVCVDNLSPPPVKFEIPPMYTPPVDHDNNTNQNYDEPESLQHLRQQGTSEDDADFDFNRLLTEEERAQRMYDDWETEREGDLALIRQHTQEGGGVGLDPLEDLADKRDVEGLVAASNCDEAEPSANGTDAIAEAIMHNRELLGLEDTPAATPLCRIRGTPLASSVDAQSKKRVLALDMAKSLLQTELMAEREKNRHMRKERLKEEETLLLVEADRKGTLPSLRRLREAMLAEQDDVMRESSEQEGVQKSGGWQKRKLLDAFGDSIRHVNRLYNRLYGVVQRSVPAHMPHFIDRTIMEELMERLKDEWEETSSHHFRAANDMQYSFSYYYFLMAERKKFNLKEIWTKYLDADRDGELSLSELRTLGALSTALPIKENDAGVCVSQLHSASHSTHHSNLNDLHALVACLLAGSYPSQTQEAVRSCPSVLAGLERWAKRLPRFPHTVLGTDDVAFLAVRDDTPEASLDGIRERRHKFVCLNDDMSHSEESQKMLESLQSFYRALVPIPSKFELPDWDPNPHLYLTEMNAFRQTVWHHLRFLHRPRLWLYVLLSISVGVLVLLFLPEVSPATKAFFKRSRFLRYFAD